MIVAETFAPSVAYLMAAVGTIATVRWTWHRKAKPGYVPLWARAYVLAILAVVTCCGLVLMATGRFRYRGKHE